MAESTHTAVAPDTCAVVAAGGLGLRFGDARGKQYVELCGLPVLDWSVAALDEAPSVGHIVIVCPHGRVEETRKIVGLIAPCVPVTFVEGGATRQESCLAGIRAVPGDFPLVANARDDASLAGAICAHPSADTLKVVEGGIVRSTPDRSRYWAVQTPQVFRRATVLEAHLAAGREGFVGTDDASLVERAGGRVAVVESPSDNMKVTVPEDRLPVEAILASRIASGEAPIAAREGARSC